MSLYTKTLFIIGSVLLLLVILLYLVSQGILLNSYNQLEERDVQQNVRRVLNAVSNELSRLSTQNRDYAHWDDTYTFVQDGNTDYIEGNLVNETFVNLGINLMAFINREGELTYAKAVDLHTGAEYPLPEDLLAAFTFQSPLLNFPVEQGGVNGILITALGPMLIDSHAILTSQMEGPTAGTLVMGYLLDETHIQELSDTLQLSLDLQPINNPALPPDFQSAQPFLTAKSDPFVKALTEDHTAGYTELTDLSGLPALILRVDMPREIYAQGQSTLSFFIAAIGFISLVFIIATLVLLDRLVLSRLSRLSGTLRAVRSSADFTRQMHVDGHDELAGLATDINATLQALAQSQCDLQNANEELEARVQKRTLELSASNRNLAEEILLHQRTQEKLALARDQALEALEIKARILANVSHDSRTPLTVILLRAEMMRNGRYGAVTEKQIETIDGILVSARQLLGFLNNLLNESQTQAKNLSAKSVAFHPRDLLNEVALTASPLVERKGLTLHTELTADVPETVHGDSERLNQVLMNLVENAIKFTNQGSIRVRIFQAESISWSLEVSDTGIGIPDDAQARIFDAFWQVDGTSSNGNNLGVGLGLSIVKQFTTLMGGQIAVSSTVGEGSTFTLTLPLRQPEQETVAENLDL